jgi:organic radical activating enzyme
MTEKSQNQLNIENMQTRMDKVEQSSCTMCTAKWLQTTLYLMNGMNHSCHHPVAHKIPPEELKDNPTALHNTKFKKEQRQLMLDGERPPECEYCWNIEDLKGDHISDRTYKSTDEQWSMPYLDKIMEAKATGNINPSYLEVAFENTCNFKCAYCSPEVSSKWMEEIKQHGPYTTSWLTGSLTWLQDSGRMPLPNREDNVYVDAFWEWWPDLYQDLNTFRITGGEPLLSKNTWKVLEYIKENPREDFNLAINTNLDVPEEFINKLIQYHNDIAPHINSFEIYTSCEAKGDAAEYIRYGMDYTRFMKNVHRVLANTEARVNFMITFNVLSLGTFQDFLKDIWNLRSYYNESDAMNRIPMMISYLRWPPFLNAQLATDYIKDIFIHHINEFIDAHMRDTSPTDKARFYLEEKDQIDRLCEYLRDRPETNARDQTDLVTFVKEYDKRRGTDFATTFPEHDKLIQWSYPQQGYHDNDWDQGDGDIAHVTPI